MAMLTDTNISTTETTNGFTARVLAFFDAVRAGQAASIEFERLQNRSDDELARHGLTRADAVRAVMDRHF